MISSQASTKKMTKLLKISWHLSPEKAMLNNSKKILTKSFFYLSTRKSNQWEFSEMHIKVSIKEGFYYTSCIIYLPFYDHCVFGLINIHFWNACNFYILSLIPSLYILCLQSYITSTFALKMYAWEWNVSSFPSLYLSLHLSKEQHANLIQFLSFTASHSTL